MRRTKAEAAITREQLIKQALKVFSHKGYQATTLDDIATEAGMTRGAIYWHFGSKAELYNTLVREYADRGNSIIQRAAADGGSLTDILKRVFIRQLQVVEEDPEMRALMELQLFKTGLIPELEQGHQQRVESTIELINMLSGIMQQGIEAGTLRSDTDAADLARTYLALQNGLIQLWLSQPGQFSLKASAEKFADLLMAGIQAQSN